MRKRRKISKKLIALKPGSTAGVKLRNQLINIELLLQRSYKESRSADEQKATEAIKTNPRYFFSYAKKFSKVNKSKIGPLLNQRNEFTSSSLEMAELLRVQYETVFSDPLPDSEYIARAASAPAELSDIQFNEQDIVTAINELSPASASGPDGLPAVYLKKLKHQIAKPLYLIWRKSLDSGITPLSLLTAHIIPIPKGDHRGIPSNYRPIALTSHLVKIF